MLLANKYMDMWEKNGDQYLLKYKDVLQAGLMPFSLISLCGKN